MAAIYSLLAAHTRSASLGAALPLLSLVQVLLQGLVIVVRITIASKPARLRVSWKVRITRVRRLVGHQSLSTVNHGHNIRFVA